MTEPVHAAQTALAAAVAAFARWLHLPCPDSVYAVLGAYAANKLPGDPVWLMVVGATSGGKTELIQPLAALPDVYPSATLTEAALLSGTPQKEQASNARGGLLRELGDFGVLLNKDFGSVLSMNRDARAQTLAALREVYDGSWTRRLGTDGGKTLSWRGKAGLIAACTPTIDRHHAVIGALGERFLLYRLPEINEDDQARRALRVAGRENDMRADLEAAVAAVFGTGSLPVPATSDVDNERLIALATFAARCRSAVERDGYSREIELAVPEAPARLVKVLGRFRAGLLAIGVPPPDAWRVTRSAALDCIPALRLDVVRILSAEGALSLHRVAEQVRPSQQTTRRALEDLESHGVAARSKSGKSDSWELTDWARERFAACFPEVSGEPISSAAQPRRRFGNGRRDRTR